MKYFSEFLPYTALSVALVGAYYLLENKLTRPWSRWLWWIGSVIIVVLTGWQVGLDHSWADFGNGYYFAGRKIMRNPEQLYYGEYCGGYVNFPLLSYLFVPFGLMAKEEAGRIFFIINVVSILPLAYWLVRFGNLNGWKRWLVLFLLMVSGPLDYSIWLGNSTNLIMLGMILALWWIRAGNEIWAGTLLGIGGLIKIPMIIPAGYFFVRRQWRVVIGGMMVVILVVVLSIILIPSSLNRMWLDNCILSFSGHPVAAYNNQSVVGVLARGLVPGSKINYWLPLEPTPFFTAASRIAVLLLYLPVLAVLFHGWRSTRTRSELLLEYFLVLVCSLLTSPISWTHYFMFLLLPVAFYLDEKHFLVGTKGLNLLLALSLILAILPVDLALSLFETIGWRIVLSVHFFGGILFYIFLFAFWMRRRTDVVEG
mgnify:CR=1 FL=1